MAYRITVTVADSHLSDADTVADQLRRAGMHVDQVLPAVGVITGSVEPADQTALSDVAGVASVEVEREFRLAPPDADVQ